MRTLFAIALAATAILTLEFVENADEEASIDRPRLLATEVARIAHLDAVKAHSTLLSEQDDVGLEFQVVRCSDSYEAAPYSPRIRVGETVCDWQVERGGRID